jgi:hypothetical protein
MEGTHACTCSAAGFANPLHHEITCPYAEGRQDFGPREDEGGEGVKPANPSDGAANANTGADQKTAPHAEQQEGAESSRVGRPSTSDPGDEGLCICTDADDPNDHRRDCPMWGRQTGRPAGRGDRE